MKKTLSKILLVGLLCYAFCASTQAEPVYFAGTGHYYEIVEPPHPESHPYSGGLPWEDCRDDAASRVYAGCQGHLATITSQDENDFIVQSFFDSSTTRCYWLGASPGNWITGETWSYENWNTLENEPRDWHSSDARVRMYGYTGDNQELGSWQTAMGTWLEHYEQSGYIVEYDNPSWSPQETEAPQHGNVTQDFDPTKPTVIITHGINTSSTTVHEGWLAQMAAEIETKNPDCNVVVLDWSWRSYTSLTADWTYIGYDFASQFAELAGEDYDLPIHLIGHSAGGHVMSAVLPRP